MSDKVKNISLLILLSIVLVGAYLYFNAWHDAKAKIAKAEQDQRHLIVEKQQLILQVADLSKQQEALVKQMAEQQQLVAQKQAEVAKIQQDLEVANAQTLARYDDQSIAQQFKDTYKLTDENIRIMSAPVLGKKWKEQVLILPIDYIKLAISAHDTKVACQQQSDLKSQIIDLNQVILDLQTHNLKLEQDKSLAYSQGYEKAFNMYLEVNKLYIDLLKSPPKVDLAPSWWQLTLGALGGALLCVI